jgi:hypothetical protein
MKIGVICYLTAKEWCSVCIFKRSSITLDIVFGWILDLLTTLTHNS